MRDKKKCSSTKTIYAVVQAQAANNYNPHKKNKKKKKHTQKQNKNKQKHTQKTNKNKNKKHPL